jgi:preprotein translocase subunit SecE
MNAKAETVGANKTRDVGLLILAALVIVAGLAGYYLLPQLSGPASVAMVLGAIVIAAGIAWFTTAGQGVRGFLRETQFEMRKVVWPTREETLRTTLVVILVVIALSIVLGLIDVILKWAILDHLLKL